MKGTFGQPAAFNRARIICRCLQMTAGDLEAIYLQGHSTITAVIEAAGLGRMCRNCVKDADDLIKMFSGTPR